MTTETDSANIASRLDHWARSTPDAAALISRDLALPVFGAALIVVAWFLPHGLAGWLDGVVRRLDARRP